MHDMWFYFSSNSLHSTSFSSKFEQRTFKVFNSIIAYWIFILIKNVFPVLSSRSDKIFINVGGAIMFILRDCNQWPFGETDRKCKKILTETIQDPTVSIFSSQQLEMRHGSFLYYLWEKPPLPVIMQVFIFNITNAEAFLRGVDKKLKVQEIGPYVYQ